MNTDKFRLKKLDRRHAFFREFSHRLEFFWNRYQLKNYHEMYCYMVENFGPGVDIQVIKQIEINSDWAYGFLSDREPYIYINDKCLTLLLLSHK